MSFDTYFSKTFQGICMERRDRDPGFSLVVARFVNFKFSLGRRYQVVQFLDCTIGWVGPSSTMNKSMIRLKRYKDDIDPTSLVYRFARPSSALSTLEDGMGRTCIARVRGLHGREAGTRRPTMV